MARRHVLREGDWTSVFERLLELVSAASGEDPFEEVFKLAVARLFAEQTGEKWGTGGARGAAALLAGASARWPGLLTETRSRLPAGQLSACLRLLSPLSLAGAEGEGLDAAFEVLVSRSAKGAKGQFFTPRHVIEACVRAVAPAPGEVVLDPACGSGGFLLHALRHAQRHAPPGADPDASAGLRGRDIDRRACRVATFLLQAAGAHQARVSCRDSLASPDDAPEADVLLTNPPFAGELQDTRLLRSYEVARPGRRTERDALFVERCVRALRPGGRMAMVLPHNKLGGQGWAHLRGWMLRQVQVVAVLGLGQNIFSPYTHQRSCVVFARRRPRPADPHPSEPVLMAVSERDGKDSRGLPLARAGASPWGPSWERLDHDLDVFVERFHTFDRAHGLGWRGG